MQGLTRILEGNRKFIESDFPERLHVYKSLKSTQSPGILMITCADSRIVPELITGMGPGELFVARNPGALVPVYNKKIAAGISASIEYAIVALGVGDIVVCGHSDCGAMKATLQPEKLNGAAAVARWLKFSEPALERLAGKQRNGNSKRQIEALTKECSRVQLEHLTTHPSVARAIDSKKITLSAAYYDIGSGRISRVAVTK